jgi:hypothetical protein
MTNSVDAVSSSKTDVTQQVHVGGGEGGGTNGDSLIEQMIYQMLLDSMQSTPQPTTDSSSAGTGGNGQPAATQINQIN